MTRPRAGAFGTIQMLRRLLRSGIALDSLLAQGLTWRDIEAEVRTQQYEPRDLDPPEQTAVRRFFALDLAPAMEPSERQPLPYSLALARQYPTVRSMAVTPLIDLLFGAEQFSDRTYERRSAFLIEDFDALHQAGDREGANVLAAMNALERERQRGRPSEGDVARLHFIHQVALTTIPSVNQALFREVPLGYSRLLRPIEDEVADLQQWLHIDVAACLLALMLEACELCDHHRFALARDALLAWLPTLQGLPECRRVGPILCAALERMCSTAIPKTLSRALSLQAMAPEGWRPPGPIADFADLISNGSFLANQPKVCALAGLNFESLLNGVKARLSSASAKAQPTHSEDRTCTANGPTGRAAALLAALQRGVIARLPDTHQWCDGSLVVLQRATRVAVVATGRYELPMLLVDFDYLRRDPVTDRPIAATPWLLAKPLWIFRKSQLQTGLDALVEHFTEEWQKP